MGFLQGSSTQVETASGSTPPQASLLSISTTCRAHRARGPLSYLAALPTSAKPRGPASGRASNHQIVPAGRRGLIPRSSREGEQEVSAPGVTSTVSGGWLCPGTSGIPGVAGSPNAITGFDTWRGNPIKRYTPPGIQSPKRRSSGRLG